jgi:hypothetical protein
LGSHNWRARFVNFHNESSIEAIFREQDRLAGTPAETAMAPLIEFYYLHHSLTEERPVHVLELREMQVYIVDQF